MVQGKYVSRDSQDIITRSRKILGESSCLDLGNLNVYKHMDDDHDSDNEHYDDHDSNDEHYDNHHDDGSVQVSLCSHITLKNTITVTNASIVTCTGIAITTCMATCPDGGIITPNTYMNMVATVNLVGIAQTDVVIQFHYLINNVPVTDPLLTHVTVNLIPGNNYVYLFPTNHVYNPNTVITFYGALIASQ